MSCLGLCSVITKAPDSLYGVATLTCGLWHSSQLTYIPVRRKDARYLPELGPCPPLPFAATLPDLAVRETEKGSLSSKWHAPS